MTPSIVGASSSVQAAPNPLGPVSRECAGCSKPIMERFLLKALDLFWHEDCLKCGCCDCRLGEVGSTLYTKANLILCKRDYLRWVSPQREWNGGVINSTLSLFRLFGTTGYCAACNKVIPAFEMVMRAKSNVYHLECFACQQCNHRWVGCVFEMGVILMLNWSFESFHQVLCRRPVLSVRQQNTLWIRLRGATGVCEHCLQSLQSGAH